MHQTAMHYPHYCYIIQRLCSFGAVHRVVHYSDLTGKSLLNSVFEVEFIFMCVICFIGHNGGTLNFSECSNTPKSSKWSQTRLRSSQHGNTIFFVAELVLD